jgi:Transposase IS116/IS110/IS902 family
MPSGAPCVWTPAETGCSLLLTAPCETTAKRIRRPIRPAAPGRYGRSKAPCVRLCSLRRPAAGLRLRDQRDARPRGQVRQPVQRPTGRESQHAKAILRVCRSLPTARPGPRKANPEPGRQGGIPSPGVLRGRHYAPERCETGTSGRGCSAGGSSRVRCRASRMRFVRAIPCRLAFVPCGHRRARRYGRPWFSLPDVPAMYRGPGLGVQPCPDQPGPPLRRTGDLRRFATARAVVKHAGLALREKLSGAFTGRTKLTGQGRPHCGSRRVARSGEHSAPTRSTVPGTST